MSRAKKGREKDPALESHRIWLQNTTDVDDLREAVEVVTVALGDRNISPADAGLFLEMIENRRRELMYGWKLK
ncbi:MAG TPA: hypothetical protein VME68_11760 [Acidobacteriaceae bacterium]|nr:hypothetical protein [Acidobacteriaceae bacterium]